MKITDFGFEKVPWEEKAKRVGKVFDSVADKYDLMNDIMSVGIHRLWKQFAIDFCQLKAGASVLDLAGGTGDMTKRILPFVLPAGRVTLADINVRMLSVAKKQLHSAAVTFVEADAQSLPFAEDTFDCIIMAFGLRNVTDKQQALNEMYRCCKVGGKVIVLEFSTVTHPLLKNAYDFYSLNVLPRLGHFIAQDSDSYRYLAESIRKHPNQQTLQNMFNDAGFCFTGYLNLSHGITALHYGVKST